MNYKGLYKELENLNRDIKKLEIEIENLNIKQQNLLTSKLYIEQQQKELEYLQHNRTIIIAMLFVLSFSILGLSILSNVWYILFLELPVVPFSIYSSVKLKKEQKKLEAMDFDNQLKELDQKISQILNKKPLSYDSIVKLQMRRGHLEAQIEKCLRNSENNTATQDNSNITNCNLIAQVNNEKSDTPKIKIKSKNSDLN